MALKSVKNPHLQEIRRAASGGRLTADGHIVIEGPHLLEEAAASRWRVDQVLSTPAGVEKYAALLSRVGAEVVEVAARAFESISGTESSQELLALVTPRSYDWRQCFMAAEIVIVLDGIQDPGNAGTIVRSAEAFGAASVILLNGCVRIANGKFLRATAGSIFRLPFLEGVERAAACREIEKAGRRLFALTAHEGVTLTKAALNESCALVVGSEAHGISAEMREAAQALVIPTRGVESLNAGVACSIALFEAARQRGLA